jgi:murein DD-endopeptidase MepM/ murein hydrolase activator NlpD
MMRMIRLNHLPLDNILINSPYGKRNIRVNGRHYWWHNGVDLKAQLNIPIYAVSDGNVAAARYDKSYGYYIALDHGKFGTLYAHLSRLATTEGKIVRAGQIIGYTGSTGDSTGPHLHFEVRLGSYENFWDRVQCDSSVFMNTVDPMLFIEDFLNRENDLSLDEAIATVQSAAGLEDKTMDYLARHYRFGEDLVKKLAKAMK